MKTVLTPADWAVLQEIVNTAADLEGGERAGYLDRACSGRPELRSRVDSLLAAINGETTVFGSAVAEAASLAIDRELPVAGARIGSYRIERMVGRGGMGVVYEAVRDDEQYVKRVAIKVVATGLFSDTLLRRFRNERQILANLDHPNIARLLDGGATEAGLPYVVMELVEGLSIDAWCANQKPSVRQKLTLFVQVARAVQHAHQKLIVHRDLKPGNILVNTEGEPKLLDFGIAKLLDIEREGGPSLTAAAGRLMTPEYASPEQIRDEPITTATDVYQLGVVLYQLLTEHLPWTPGQDGSSGLMGIWDREPRRPGVDPDLDRVLLKALERDPSRRYVSASEFADDLERYLGGYPVEARPGSWTYIFSRFIRRHRLASAVVAVFLILLAAAVAEMAVLTKRARIEAKTANEISNFLVDIFSSNDPRNGRGDQVTARELLDQGTRNIGSTLKDSPEIRARLLDTVGGIYTRLGAYAEANRLLDESIGIRRNVLHRVDLDLATALSNKADNVANMGSLAESEKWYREACEVIRKAPGAAPDDTAGCLANLSSVLFDEGKLQEAETINAQAVEMRKRILGLNAPDTLVTMNNLETVYMQEGKYVDAEALAREVLARRQSFENEWHSDLAYSWGNLAMVLSALAKYQEAETAARKALEIRLKAFPPEHPQIQWGRTMLAGVLNAEGKSAEAEPLARTAVEKLMATVGPNHGQTAYAKQAFGIARLHSGDAAGARVVFAETLAAREKVLSPGSQLIAHTWLLMAEADAALHHLAAAEDDANRAAAMFQAQFGSEHIFFAEAQTVQAEIAAAEQRWQAAETLGRHALAINRAHLPAGHPAIARTLSILEVASRRRQPAEVR
jgi:serine/threonine-protein kinase